MLSQKISRMFLIITLASLSAIGLKAQDVHILIDSLQIKDKEQQRDCKYLENLYNIGNCYIELKQYSKAEYYYRKAIIESDILGIDCSIKKKTLAKMAELYNATGYQIFADYCTSLIDNDVKYDNVGDYNEQLHELTSLYDAYSNQGMIEESVQALHKILDHIENNRGKKNDFYIIYENLLASILWIELNMQEEATKMQQEIIEIGESLNTYNRSVYDAYESYLTYLSDNNQVDSINYYLPKAIEYLKKTNDSISIYRNLYEIIGIGLCNANNIEEGIKYLERPWNGKTANSLSALTFLGSYYIEKDIPQAISYYREAFDITETDSIYVTDKTRRYISEYLMYLYDKVDNISEAINFGEISGKYIEKNEDYDYFASHLFNLGNIYIKAKKYDKAQDIILRIKPILNHMAVDKNIDYVYYCGFVYLASKEYDKAIEIYEYGIKYIVDNKGSRDKELITIYNNIGYIYMLIHDYKEALINLNKSKDLQIELNGEVMQSTMDYIRECLEK